MMVSGGIDPRINDLAYSIRRYYVDVFLSQRVASLEGMILDLGGERIHKRGQFDIEAGGLRVVYANYSTEKMPHVQADAARVPFRDQSFEGVICSEVLEHLPDPRPALCEMFRVLKPGGQALICVPFLFRIHGNPCDYGRYTDHFWRENLAATGFAEIEIETQGLFWSVVADMFRDLVYQKERGRQAPRRWARGFLTASATRLRRMAIRWDASAKDHNHFASAYTTGYGIKALRPAR